MTKSSLYDSLEAAAETDAGIQFPGETAEHRRRLSYAALHEAATRVGSHLAERLPPGRPILVALPNGPDAVVTFFGAIQAGLVPAILPLPRALSDGETWARSLVAVARKADDAPVITMAPIGPMLRAHPETRHLDVIDPRAFDADIAASEPRRHEVAMLQFTSGSLGTPKGVVLTHDAVLADAIGIAQAIGATSEDIGCFWVPLCHDMGLIGSLSLFLHLRAELVMMSTQDFAKDPGGWLRTVARTGATYLSGPPFAFEYAARRLVKELEQGQPLPDLSRIKGCVIGAEPIDARVLRRVVATLGSAGFPDDPWFMAYGLAEYACVASVKRGLRTVVVKPAPGLGQPVVDDAAGLELVSCGEPLRDTELRVVDASGEVVGERVAGRIQVRGRAIMTGYWRDLEATTEDFDDTWVRTGDVGFLDAGEVFISGREKDVIILHGRHYFPEEIEAVLQDLPDMRPGGAVAFGVVDPSGGPEQVVVAVEVAPGVDFAALERAVRVRVADRLDLRVDVVKPLAPRQIPRTTSGKPRRGEAKKLFSC